MEATLPLPDFRPDQSDNSGFLTVCKNVVPSPDGYRAVGSISTISDALAANFLGGAASMASDGAAFLFAGTATNLYKITSAGAWTSILSGLTVTGRWKFATFKDLSENDVTIAVNGTTTSYAVDLSLGTAASIAAMPGATDVEVIGDFVVIARPDGDLSKVAWSAFGDHTAWTLAVNQSGEQAMRTGGPVQAIAGGEYGIILQRNRIVRMTPTGDNLAPFQFDEISANFGCASGNTVAQAGRTIFFLSDRGFMALDDGQDLRPIGTEKVDRAFTASISSDDFDMMYAAIDPQNKLVFWLIPGNPGTLWVYNFELDKWSNIEVSAVGLFPGFTTSFTTDNLAGLGYTFTDDAGLTDLSVDDPRWMGGSPKLYAVTNTNRIGNFAGDNLAATLTFGNVQLSAGRTARLRAIRPFWDGTSGITASITAKDRLGDTGTATAAGALRTSGIMPVRTRGRHLSGTVSITAATDWNYIQAIDFEFEQGGKR